MAQQGLMIPILADLTSFERSMSGLSQKIASVGSSLSAKLTLPIVGIGALATKAASDLQQTERKIETIFGNMSQDVWNWANENERAYGLGAGTIAKMSADFADLTMGAGMTAESAFTLSQEATELAVKLGNWNGIDASSAMEDIKKATMGSTEAVQKYGVKLNEAVFNEQARRMGLKKSFNQLTEAQKAEVRYASIVSASGNAIKFWDEGNRSLAFTLGEIKEQIGNVMENIGKTFLPIIEKITKKIADMTAKFAKFTADNPKALKIIIGIAGALASVGPILMIVSKGMLVLSKLPLLFSPAGLAITGIVGVIIALKVAIDKNIGGIGDKFKVLVDKLKVALENVKKFFSNIAKVFGESSKIAKTDGLEAGITNFISKIFNIDTAKIAKVFEEIKKAIDIVGNGLKLAYDFLIKPAMDAIMGVVKELAEWFTENFDQIKETVMRVFGVMKQWFTTIVIPVFKFLAVAIGGAIRLIIEAVKFITPAIKPVMNFILDAVNVVISVISGLVSAVAWAIDAIIITAKFLWDSLKGIFNFGIEFITGLYTAFSAMFRGDWEAMGQALVGVAKTIWDGVSQAFMGLFNWINDIFGGYPAKMLQYGKDMISGLINGIKNMVGSAVETIKDVGNKLMSGIKSVLGINSPSKVFTRYGEWTSEGLAIGISKKSGLADKATRNLGEAVKKAGSSVFSTFDGIQSRLVDMSDMRLNTSISATKVQRYKEFNIGAKKEEAVIENIITLDGRVLTNQLSPKFNVASGNRIKVDGRRMGVK